MHNTMNQRGYSLSPSSQLSPRGVIIDHNNCDAFKSPFRKFFDGVSLKSEAIKGRANLEKSPVKSKRKEGRTQEETDLSSKNDTVKSKKQDRKSSKTKKDSYSQCSTDIAISKDDPCSPRRISTTSKQRRVGFHLNKNGSVSCTEYKYPFERTSGNDDECDKSDLWWSKKDRKETRSDAKIIMQLIQIQRPEYREASLQLLSKFGGMELPLDFQLSDHDAVIISATSGARGLEKWVYPFLGIPNPDYYTSVKRLVAAQQRFIQEGCFDANALEAALAKQYVADSYPASAMARLLADGDCLVARTTEMVQI